MCGFAGFVGAGGHEDLREMTAALAHRGPDDESFYLDPDAHVFLGHRRLAIIDIDGGRQPMWNEDSDVGVVFNGEIYNHVELRRELVARGHVFRSSHSDTEVLVHGFEEWGEDLPLRLNGMFAFAVYDRGRRSVFLARDRFGEKPLYYTRQNGFFGFASELQALHRHRLFDPTIDPRSVQKFFAYGYIPAPNALFRNSFKLPGGSRLRYDLDTGEITSSRYWRFTLEPDESLDDSAEDELAEELRHLLTQAVKRRLMSDVPLGVFLSGGIDSSSLVALAATQVPADNLKTLTIGFREPSFDESAYAREVAAAIGTDHQERQLGITAARDLMPGILGRLDEPLGDASILPMYLLSDFARTQVTVALSGDGGDELFAGYDPFRALRPAGWYRRLTPPPLHRGMRRLADMLPISVRNMSLDFKVRRSLTGLSYPSKLWNPVWLGPVEPDAIAELFLEPVRVEEVYSEALSLWDETASDNLIDKTLEFYTNLYLQDDILMKVDRASMMVSLESRAVFLDNDVVDFARRLPHRFKFRNGTRKYLLKKALTGLLPDRILRRRKKGFGIPLTSWLREFPPILPMHRVDGIDAEWVNRRWHEHRRGKADHHLFLWSWLSFQHVYP